MNKVALSDIAAIQLGMYTQPAETGPLAYLVVKDFTDSGMLAAPPTNFVSSQVVADDHFLRSGDVLLTAKGYRHFAWTYDASIGPAIASPAFFIIRPKPHTVMSDYLTLLLNTPQSKNTLLTLGGGTSIPSIRKSELEALLIDLPPLGVQQKLIDLDKIHRHEMELSRAIITEKEKVFQAVIRTMITGTLMSK